MDVDNLDYSPKGIVALGLSAGGYEAAGIFFDYITASTGLAFVIIDHKHLGVEYSLSRYFQAHTDMNVVEITDGLRLLANTVYTTPSKDDVIIDNGFFKTLTRKNNEIRENIDAFFTSLAVNEGQSAIAILFSGMLKDGVEGMKEIKQRSGTTIVQDPQTAHYSSMPQSAINAGLVDYVFTPSQMAEFLQRKFPATDLGMLPFHPRKDNLIKYFGNLDRLLNNLNRPILVLDNNLRILGFGGAIRDFVPVIDSDIGRNISDLSLKVSYDSLVTDINEVFRTSGNKELDVTGPEGTPYLLRISSGDYAPTSVPICILSLIPLFEKIEDQAENDQISKRVAQYGIVLAHVDENLRYTWILNPHPDYSASESIGKTDIEIAQNDGTIELMALKQRVLEGGLPEEKTIQFPLSNGLISYSISANAIKNKAGNIIGVSTVGVEFC